MQVSSDDFTSPMMRGDKRTERRDRDRVKGTAGEEEKARQEFETPGRGVGDGGAQ